MGTLPILRGTREECHGVATGKKRFSSSHGHRNQRISGGSQEGVILSQGKKNGEFTWGTEKHPLVFVGRVGRSSTGSE